MEINDYHNYLIYEDGRVFTKKNNRFLKQATDRKGYKYVDLWNNGRKNFRIHRLIAIHYIPNPENKPQVDHIDRDKSNNNINNLRWVSKSENQQNTIVRKTNKLGIKNICYDKRKDKYNFQKRINGVRHQKWFKTLDEAIEYKNDYCAVLTSAPVVPSV